MPNDIPVGLLIVVALELMSSWHLRPSQGLCFDGFQCGATTPETIKEKTLRRPQVPVVALTMAPLRDFHQRLGVYLLILNKLNFIKIVILKVYHIEINSLI